MEKVDRDALKHEAQHSLLVSILWQPSTKVTLAFINFVRRCSRQRHRPRELTGAGPAGCWWRPSAAAWRSPCPAAERRDPPPPAPCSAPGRQTWHTQGRRLWRLAGKTERKDDPAAAEQIFFFLFSVQFGRVEPQRFLSSILIHDDASFLKIYYLRFPNGAKANFNIFEQWRFVFVCLHPHSSTFATSPPAVQTRQSNTHCCPEPVFLEL